MVAAPIAVAHPPRRGISAITEKAPISPTAITDNRVWAAVATCTCRSS
jgi:hypothetical protein